MSGICGIVRLDDSHVSPAEIRAMTRALERRGPDGTSEWIEGGVALGHTLLATTPEALVERLPLTDPGSGCTITADVRLDNREELLPALGLDSETRVVGDGELILRAYVEWGEDCPKHLLGDFAFAIWDPRSQQLFCARDHMGMRQLIYHHDAGRHFVFATEAEAVLAHPAVPRRINEGRIADFLDNLEGLDLTSTFFGQVYRLPPAHSLRVSARGMSMDRYWDLQLPPKLELRSDKDYADAFMEVFRRAVRCRLRSPGPIGATLSGGIDSNAVVAVAAGLLAGEKNGRLLTFSGVGPDPATCVETRAILAASAGPNLLPHLVDYSRLKDRIAEVGGLTLACDEPFDAHMTLLRTVYLDAHRAGVRTVLDGAGGDVVLGAGDVVAQQLASGRVFGAISELGGMPKSVLELKWRTRRLLAAAWATFAPTSLSDFRRNLTWRIHDDRALRGKASISADLANRVDLAGRRNRLRGYMARGAPFGRRYRRDCIIHPHLVVGRERYDRIASSLAIEPRDPYLDLNVIRFCLSLPSEQVQANGVSKVILRRAMQGLCPPEVLSHLSKEHLGWDFTQAFFPYFQDRGCCGRELLARYVSTTAISTANSSATKVVDRQRWFDLCVLGEWLYRNSSPRLSGVSEGE